MTHSMRRQQGGHFSVSIAALVADLRAAGVDVELFATDLPAGVYGVCHTPDFDGDGIWIRINVAAAKEALFTLAHETGHLTAWRSLGDRYPKSLVRREAAAMRYGWPVLWTYWPHGAVCAPTEQQWKRWHPRIRRGEAYGSPQCVCGAAGRCTACREAVTNTVRAKPQRRSLP